MRLISFCLLCVIVLFGCASEDPNIVNPPAGSKRIVVRLFNMVPDGVTRRMLLEQGYQSTDVGQFKFSDSVRSPGDSSFIEILAGGTTEFRTPQRVQFVSNSVYDVFTTSAIGQQSKFDSVLITNANAALTTVPVAQVRVINLVADTSLRFDVRVGCPNGTPLTLSPVNFRQASLYSEVYPGFAVFSVSSIKESVSSVIGTYQTSLGERKAYSIIIYRDAVSTDALFLFIEEGDLTKGAERPFIPVETRTADVRVINVSTAGVDVSVVNTGQPLANGLASGQIGSISTVPTCEGDRADVFKATFSDGTIAEDSTSLSVRGKFSVITVDSADVGRMIIAPTIQRPFGSVGKSVVRVINASSASRSIVVSLGARSNPSAPNGIAAGFSIARDVLFGGYSQPVTLEPGLLPLTITTSTTPTIVLDVTRANILPDKNYDLIIYDEGGSVRTTLVEDDESSIAVTPLFDAVFFRLVNGSVKQPSVPIQVGLVLPSGSIYYRNSVATTLPVGTVPYNINGVSGSFQFTNDERTTAIYADGGGSPNVIQISSPPLTPVSGFTSRRVVNATEDIRLVSVCIDSVPKVAGIGDHLAKDVSYGKASEVYTSDRDSRGTYYVYDAETLAKLYSFPVQLAPMGNNYTFIVVGRKESGYEVIVSQEF